MIIIEGTDCVGKTTLAKALSKELLGIYVHMGVLPESWRGYQDYVQLLRGPSCCVIDRFAWSGLAYEAVCDSNPCKLSLADVLYLRAFMRNVRAMHVLILASDELIKSRYDESRELFSLQPIIDVNAWFRQRQSDFDLVINRDITNPYASTDEVLQSWSVLQQNGRRS